MLAVALATILTKWVVVPAWNYYSLPSSTRSILARLSVPLRMTTPASPSVKDLLKSVRLSSPDSRGVGIPIYVDPPGLDESRVTLNSSIKAPRPKATIGDALEESLRPLGLGYYVEDGLLRVTSEKSVERPLREKPRTARHP